MTTETTDSTLYVEMDTILDTRLSCILENYGPSKAIEVIESGYHDRWVDNFIGIDYQDFQQRYKNRTKTVLRHALMTPICNVIQEFVLGTLKNNHNTPFALYPKICLNIYPYDLNDSEIKVIRDVIVSTTKNRCDVEIVSMSVEQLTPSVINSSYSLMVMYDYDKWLETHSSNGNFKKIGCPDVGLFSPMMFKKYPITDADKRVISGLGMSPFEYITKVSAPFIRFIFLPVEHFSLLVKPVANDP